MYDCNKAAKYWGNRIKENRESLKSVLSLGEREIVNKYYDIWEKSVVCNMLVDTEAKNILDVPVGIGRWMSTLVEMGMKVVGMDVSEEALTIARENTNMLRQNKVSFVKASASELPFPMESFDYVLCTGLFEHLPKVEYKKVTYKMARITKSGGMLILVVNNKHNRFLQNPSDNPNRIAKQLENGYYCGLTDIAAVVDIMKTTHIDIVKIASNPNYSMLRQITKDVTKYDILEDLFFNAINNDILYFSNLSNIQSELADNFILFGRKK